ncbi:hypothetical protein [Dielma fastidiosa]|uniref:hypothetical protein n=1 Tax=Dielma fastidiosa TaxID=1034346 RepID=UPI003567F1A4
MAEEIVISNKNKIRVGRLIRIYQKEMGITLFDLIENVCSRQVATNFNKDIPAKNDEFYLGALAKLGFNYNYRHDMDDYILNQCRLLRDAVEWYDTKMMEKICYETIKRLEPYRKYIIEYEYIRAFEMIYKFSFVSVMVEEEIDHFIKSMQYLNQDIIDVLSNVIFKFCYKFYDSVEGSKSYQKAVFIYNKLDLEHSEYSVNQLNYAVYLLTLKFHFDSLKILIRIEDLYREQQNYNGLLLVYNKMFWLISNIQEKSIERYEVSFNDIVNNKDIKVNQELVMQGRMNLALNYFENGYYLKSKKYFLETIGFEKYYVKSAICLKLIEYCENDFTSDFVMKPVGICKIITEREKAFYEYYYMKSMNCDITNLINYLDSYVLSNIESRDSFYYIVFINEIKCLSKALDHHESNRRKLMKIYDKFRKM